MENTPLVFVRLSRSGLGQSTQSIALIRGLLRQGMRVLAGGSKRTLGWLIQEFPGIQTVSTFETDYSEIFTQKSSGLKRLIFLVRFMGSSFSERLNRRKICRKYHVQAIISESPFSAGDKLIPSVFLATQPWFIPAYPPGLYGRLLRRIIVRAIRAYYEVWIPDTEDQRISGPWGVHKYHRNLKFVGTLIEGAIGKDSEKLKDYDLSIILSGAEPQRSILEEKIIRQAKGLEGHFMIVRGMDGTDCRFHSLSNISIVDCLSPGAIRSLIERSTAVLCRPDYITLLEISGSGIPVIMVPSPDQPCQEYLATQFSQAGYGLLVKQEALNLQQDLIEIQKKEAIPTICSQQLLSSAIEGLGCLIKNDQICSSIDENNC